MLHMNQQMVSEISCLHKCEVSIPNELQAIIDAGFLEIEECYLLRVFGMKRTNVTLQDFPDRTGFECFLNSVHVDDYLTTDYLASACRFAEMLLDAWRGAVKTQILNVIISKDDMGTLVKCHVARKNESWLASDLEKYEEAILIVDSAHKGIICSPNS